MPVQKYIERVRYIDAKIRTKSTGSAKQLAKNLNLSERQTLEFLKEMKELGCPIKFSRKRNSYYYDAEGEVSISFFDRHFAGMKKNDADKTGGGGVKKPI
ncbi:MAG: hypothetical protein ABI685_06555 [Ferruginibacter sp.]